MVKLDVICTYLRNRFIFCRGSKKRNEVFLTFDDGPFPEKSERVLDILREYSVKATFFLNGSSVSDNPETAERIIQEGHDVGNHFFYHKKTAELSYAELSEEIRSCEELLHQYGASNVDLVRPPYGTINMKLLRYCLTKKKKIVMWSYDCRDCFIKTEDDLAQFKKDLRITPGEVFLLHDDSMYIEDFVKWIIERAKEQELDFLKVSELTI